MKLVSFPTRLTSNTNNSWWKPELPKLSKRTTKEAKHQNNEDNDEDINGWSKKSFQCGNGLSIIWGLFALLPLSWLSHTCSWTIVIIIQIVNIIIIINSKIYKIVWHPPHHGEASLREGCKSMVFFVWGGGEWGGSKGGLVKDHTCFCSPQLFCVDL